MADPDDLDQESFIVLVTQVCEHARLAGRPVSIVLSDGKTANGVPRPSLAEADDPFQADDSGYSRQLGVGDDQVDLNAIVEIRVRHHPGSGSRGKTSADPTT